MLRWKFYLKHLHIGTYELAAFAIIACAVGLRIFLDANHLPTSSSDEGTFGIEALHIAFQGQHPIFMYGQNYMGALESYVAVPFIWLFGASLFTFRFGMIFLFTLFLTSMYLLTKLLYSRRMALATLGVLALGSSTIMLSELRAMGGEIETMLFGSLSILLALWLALTATVERRQQKRWQRHYAYIGWGLVVGLGLWSDMLVAPFVLAGGLILLACCYREWRSRAIPCIIAGTAIGGFPLIYYNLTAPLSQNSVAIALSIQGGHNAVDGIVSGHIPILQHLSGTFLYSLPDITGYIKVCDLNVLPFYGHTSSDTLLCTIPQGGWSLLYISLLLVSIAMALVPLWRLLNALWFGREIWSEEQRQAAVMHFARLMLIGSGVLTIILFLISPLTAVKPTNTRYLVGLLVIIPAMLWPIWKGLSLRVDTTMFKSLLAVSSYTLLLLIVIGNVGVTVSMLQTLPADQATYQSDMVLIHDLEQRGITRFYSEYWTCYRLAFESNEKIICSVIDLSFHLAGVNRISSYVTRVAADLQAPYLLPDGQYVSIADQNPTFAKHYRRIVLDGYVLYQLK
jgi:hypothetical protein